MLTHDFALFGRVALGMLLGFLVGWEREIRGHPAGARTFAMVAGGSAALTAIAVDAFPATAEKLIAGIVTGIGFIGAGLVIRETSGQVRGLTTASAIWAITAVGITAGAGRFVLAALVAAMFLFVLELPNIPLIGRLDPRRWESRFAKEPDRKSGV